MFRVPFLPIPYTIGLQQPNWGEPGPSGNESLLRARPISSPTPCGNLHILGSGIVPQGVARVQNTASPVYIASTLQPSIIAGLMRTPNTGMINY